MPIELRPVDKDQLHEAARLAIAAHANNPFRNLILPNGMSQASYDKSYQLLVNYADDPDSNLLQLYDTEAGKMVAIAVWCWTKSTSDEEWDRKCEERLNAYPEARQEILRPFLRKEGEAKKKVMGQQRWWELVVLTVDLQYQRKGLGGRLMEWGIEELERRHLPSVIVSTKVGYGLYLKYGFETQDIWYVDLEQWGGEGTYMNAILTRYPKGWGAVDQVE